MTKKLGPTRTYRLNMFDLEDVNFADPNEFTDKLRKQIEFDLQLNYPVQLNTVYLESTYEFLDGSSVIEFIVSYREILDDFPSSDTPDK